MPTDSQVIIQAVKVITYDVNPDVKAAMTGISFPFPSRAGLMSNTLRIEATAMNTELSAIYRPGQMLLGSMGIVCVRLSRDLTVSRTQTWKWDPSRPARGNAQV
jgi:hypothetical protein